MSDENKKDWKKFRDAAEQMSESEESFEEDAEQASLAHPDYKELEEQLTLAEQKAHENWEKAVRAMAELENIKKRAERDVEHAHRFGLEKLITSLIPVLDSLEQALQLAEKEGNQGMQEGLALTLKLFIDVLEKSEVEQINPQGEAFDPQHHEAMSMMPSDEHPTNTVLDVFQKGYKLNQRVIRPARVIVSKKNS